MPGGRQNSGSVRTTTPVQCDRCRALVYKQYASIVWCDCGQWYGNQMGVHHDRP